jgi:hypothetical protein
MRLEALKEFCRFARRNWRRACARAGMTTSHSYSEHDTSANVTPRQGATNLCELRRSVGAVMPAIELVRLAGPARGMPDFWDARRSAPGTCSVVCRASYRGVSSERRRVPRQPPPGKLGRI